MGRKRGRFGWQFDLFLCAIIFICSLIATISINIAISRIQYPQPQAILCLGGGRAREIFAAELASQNPQLIVWVSTGSDYKTANQVFRNAGIPTYRYFLDRRATDTVTNFTTLVEDFKQHQIKHLYLLTADFHMARARAIATIILGSQGIAFTPIPIVDSTKPRHNESTGKISRDICRSILWILSGYTGASLKGI